MNQQERLQQARMEKLRKEIRAGIAQADCGELIPLDIEHIKAEGRRRFASQQKRN